MSRITAPAARLSKALGSSSSSSAPGFRAGATIAPKYADLLRDIRPRDPTKARTLSTTQNPLRRPVSATPSHPSSAPVDAAVLPNLFASAPAAGAARVPVLLDASGTAQPLSSSSSSSLSSLLSASSSPSSSTSSSSASSSEALSSAAFLAPRTTIVAANPANVEPSSMLTTVSHMGGVDGVELHWTRAAHEQSHVGGMLKNIWNGLMGGLHSQPHHAAN